MLYASSRHGPRSRDSSSDPTGLIVIQRHTTGTTETDRDATVIHDMTTATPSAASRCTRVGDLRRIDSAASVARNPTVSQRSFTWVVNHPRVTGARAIPMVTATETHGLSRLRRIT